MVEFDPRTEYLVQRETVVDAPRRAVYEQLVDFHRWTAWSPWEDVDPDMDRSYAGSEHGPGATYAWSGNRKAGAGRMVITEVVPDERVDIDLHFLKPFKADNRIVLQLDPQGEATRITWSMVGRRTFMTRVMGIFTSMDTFVGKDFDKGLAQLTALVERTTGPEPGPDPAPT
jgi:Polyketide cyclase / dehydrase and lipid transport